MQHIIRKQTWDLLIDGRLDAFRIQQILSTRNRDSIIPLLEKEFDRLSSDDEVISLDRLEIDLGAIPESRIGQPGWDSELIKRVQEQIQSLNTTSGAQSGDPAAVRRTPAWGRYRQWLFYMQKGYLPWNVLRISPDWQLSVLEQLATDHAAVAELRREIGQHPQLLTRIVRQHTEPMLVQLVEILTACQQTGLLQIVREWKQLIEMGYSPTPGDPASTEFVWKEIIIQAATAASGTAATALVQASWQRHRHIPAATLHQHRVFLDELLQSAHGIVHLLPVLREEQKALRKAGATEQNSKASFTGKPQRTTEQPEVPAHAQKLHTDAPVSSGNASAGNGGAIPGEGVFVTHAGLVLLHPFLPFLFRHSGLVEGKAFINDAAREQALYLLHYAATGQVAAEEHELVIPKLLCGYALEEPVTVIASLPVTMLEETDNMLRAAIAQWSILKSTSPDGLREGFLQRNGKVSCKNDKTYVQVEQAAVDVLLDQLPWNLSMVRMPWLSTFLMVEWR